MFIFKLYSNKEAEPKVITDLQHFADNNHSPQKHWPQINTVTHRLSRASTHSHFCSNNAFVQV